MMNVRILPMGVVPQDQIEVTFDGKNWTRIGYMGHGSADPFNGLPEFTKMAEEDRNDILELIWQQKGRRKANLFRFPTDKKFWTEDNSTPGQPSSAPTRKSLFRLWGS